MDARVQGIVFDACVVGAGPAGLTAALALAARGARVVCVAPAMLERHTRDSGHPTANSESGAGLPLSRERGGERAVGGDTRTAALLMSSVRLLANLGVWEACAGAAAALAAIRILDDTGRLVRCPDVAFAAEELGAAAFGYNVPNAALIGALSARAAAGSRALVDQTVTAIEPGAEDVRLRLADGRVIAARLAVGADGRHSLCRRAAGISARAWRYPQTAIACNFTHAAAHDNVCTELHRAAGPLTAVPLPGRESSLVWVETPEEAGRLTGLDASAFARVLEERLHGLLGAVRAVGPRAAFPLAGLSAASMARGRIALVGEAGHVVPPIGAQGLNLGLRDAAALADCVGAALARGADPGGEPVLAAYAAARARDVTARGAAVDLLNRSLLSGFLPVQAARALGLSLAGGIGPLRRFLMRQGMGESADLPALMR